METVIKADSLDMDYNTYIKQPTWFVELLLAKRKFDSEFKKPKS